MKFFYNPDSRNPGGIGLIIMMCLPWVLILWSFRVLDRTIINAGALVGISAVYAIIVAAVTTYVVPVLRWSPKKFADFLVTAFSAFMTAYGAFLLINYYGASNDNVITTQAEVTDKESHWHNGVTHRASHNAYYIDVFIPEAGKEFSITVSAAKYKNLRIGDNVPLTIKRGFLGYPVFTGI